MTTKEQLKALLAQLAPADDLLAQIRRSPSAKPLLEAMRTAYPDLGAIPLTTYTRYRQFEYTGERDGYQTPYFAKRSMLTRGVLEMILGDESTRDAVHDLLWSICEETNWVLPAHEEQGPDYWDLHPPKRTWPLGAHTALTREPDSIDLFAAETGAALAETIFLLGDRLAPEVRQRVRQEVERRIFKPYLAYGREHWWFKGALNWNGVCNGSIGLAFLRLEQDLETLAEALAMVLEGFEAYIATGFEADGGSIEGVGYWNYGLMYFVTVAELLRELTAGQIDLLSTPRMRDIAAYAPGLAFTPTTFINFGDATEAMHAAAGIVQRLAERTGVEELRALLAADRLDAHSAPIAKLPIMLRHAAWWDSTKPVPPLPHRDYFLPECHVIKFTGKTSTGQTVILAAKGGHNDGHHSHTDIGQFILNIGGESLLPDAGRGLYSKQYFRQQRYDNVFNNSFNHNVPRIGGRLQSPGPEFGGRKQFFGKIVDHGERDGQKFAVVEFQNAYDLPALKRARRTLNFDPKTGASRLEDEFAFEGAALEIEEAFVSWAAVSAKGGKAQITGKTWALDLTIDEPKGAAFTTTSLEAECRANRREGVLTRLAVSLPAGATRFRMTITPRAL